MKQIAHHKHHSEEINSENEKTTLVVIFLTVVTMIFEIACGFFTNSMALLADGFHMSTHVLCLSIAYVAYIFIRKMKHRQNSQLISKKISALAGYTSAILLFLSAFAIMYESFERFIHPLKISFNQAIFVAILGFFVNFVCIIIMHKKHSHQENGKETDYNFKAAYMHILADTMTSVFAILALLVGKFFNFYYFDTLSGVLGAILILKWSIELLKNTGKKLLSVDLPVEKID